MILLLWGVPLPRTLSTTHSHRPVPITLQPGQFWSTGSSLGHAKIKLQMWVSKGWMLVPSWFHLSWTIRSASPPWKHPASPTMATLLFPLTTAPEGEGPAWDKASAAK